MPSRALLSSALLLSLAPLAARAQVTATGTNGPTNPPAPTLGAYNQSSDARLLSLNSVDDFCLFAPPDSGSTIGNEEAEVVAWCTKPRNNARLIPDGTITAAHYVKNDLYVQIVGKGNLTALNIAPGDEGGELDPHGATGDGNPVGGNVTSNVSGEDVFYEEWMQYISDEDFCFRICIAESSNVTAAIRCQHVFDEMGCTWVMPGDYTDNSFTSCDADAAFPPGVYPKEDGSYSTFQQLYTGTADGQPYTIGYSETPSAAYSTPASSNCQTMSSISNGVTELASTAAATSAAVASGSAAVSGGSKGASTAANASKTNGAAAAGASDSASASRSSDTSDASRRWMLKEVETVVAAAGMLFAGGVGMGAVLL